MCKHAEKENGLHDILEIMLESPMIAERGEFLSEQTDRNKGNVFRLDHTYGHGRKLVHIKVFCKRKTAAEAFYVILGVTSRLVFGTLM